MRPDASLKKRLIIYGTGLFVLALVQLEGSLHPAWPLPDFLLLLPLMAGLWTPGHDSFILGLAAGFLRDYAAGRGYGAGMLLGMLLGLLASYLAREAWRAYAIRGGLLVLVAGLVQELILSLLVWLLPLGDQPLSLGSLLLQVMDGLPVKTAANLAGALLLTGIFSLVFRDWKKADKSQSVTSGLKGADHV